MRDTYLIMLVFCCFLSTAQANTYVIESDSTKGAEYYLQGKNLYKEGKIDEAVEAYKKARDAFGKENLKGYGLSIYKIGHVYDRSNQERKALPFYLDAVEAGNELFITQGDNDVLARTLLMMGYVYYFFEDHHNTNKTLNRLLKLEFTDSLRTARSQTYCHNVLAGNYQKLGDYDSALYHAKRALITSKPIGIDYIQAKGQAYNCNAELQYNLGNFESAQKYLDEQIALYQDAYGENHPYTIKPTMELGIIAFGASNYKRARDYFERAIWLAKNIGDSTSHDFATLVINASNLYTRTGDYAKSIKYMQVAIDIYEDKLPDIADLYDGYAIMAEEYARMGEVETSNMYAEKAMKFLEDNGGNLNFTHKILNKLTAAALANKDYERSLEIGTRALKIGKELYGSSGRSIAAAYLRLASVNQYKGKNELSSKYIDSASFANTYEGNIRSNFIEIQIETQRLELINHQLISNGVAIETVELENLLTEFEQYIASIKKGINSEIGESFNINDYTATAIELCYNLYMNNKDSKLIDFMFQLSERSKSLGLKDYLSKASFFNNASLSDEILRIRKETVDGLMILKKRIEEAKDNENNA
ncbi:MAG: tetratricopeptide repeat protein [bacterium]|nr:tetratricopeptide repeat protein [bacterium]